MATLEEIDAALVRQKQRVREAGAAVEVAVRRGEMQAAAQLRLGVVEACRVFKALEQARERETPLDARGSRGSTNTFVGGRS